MSYIYFKKIFFKVYNKYVEKTQEISSLEYFTFVRLDCEKLRKVASKTHDWNL